MDDDKFAPFEQDPSACPFVALEDDRDRRSDVPDYRHRCFASLQPEPRAFPHQERYCLSRGFTGCPIFLDWAQREAASVVPGRRSRTPAAAGAQPAAAAAAGAGIAAAAGAASGPTDDDVDVSPVEEIGAPAFLAGRGRAAAHVPEPDTVVDPDEGLWGPQEPRRPGRQAMATARPNRNRPDWEPAMREERYPRIRKRSSAAAFQTIAIVVVAVAALAVLFFFLPGLLPSASHAKATPTATVRVTPTPVPTVTATPQPTPQQYVIKDGDSFSGIAAKFGLTVDELKAANPQVKNIDLIAAGDTLTIPVKGGTQPSPVPSASTKP